MGLAFTLSSFGVWSLVRASIAAYVTVPVWVCVLMPALCIVLGCVVAVIRGSTKMLPDSFVDEVGSDGPYTCAFATDESLREACELTRPHYGREFVGHELAEQWRLANPRAFECIHNSKGELCASFGVFALCDSFMDLFVDGRVTDLQLKQKDIVAGAQAKKCARLYISGVVVRDSGKMAGHKRARVMLWAMLRHLKREYGVRKTRELYAIAVTTESKRLMSNLKFNLVTDGKFRTDKCPLYRYVLTGESWRKLLCEIGDCTSMCKVNRAAREDA